MIGFFIEDQYNNRGLCQFPALKIRFKEAEFFKVESREKNGESKGFERRKVSGEQNVEMAIMEDCLCCKLIKSIKLLKLT